MTPSIDHVRLSSPGERPETHGMNPAVRWAGPALALGGVGLGASIVLIVLRPVVNQALDPGDAALMLTSATLLLLALPAMYAVQANGTDALGLVGHVLLEAGLLLLVIVAALPLADPSFSGPYAENAVFFVLGIAFSLGLLLTAFATLRAGVLPRGASLLVLAATIGFFFAFFIAENLPPPFLPIGTAGFAALLAVGFAWLGVALWSRASG